MPHSPCSSAPLPVVPRRLQCGCKTEKHFVSLVSTCLLALWFYQFYLKESEIECEKDSAEEGPTEWQWRWGEERFPAAPDSRVHVSLDATGAACCVIPPARPRPLRRGPAEADPAASFAPTFRVVQDQQLNSSNSDACLCIGH